MRETATPDMALDVRGVIDNLPPHLRTVAHALLDRDTVGVDAVCRALNCSPRYARRQIERLREACLELGLGAYGR